MALITKDSIPEDEWGCEQWKIWHEKLRKYYGKNTANELWMAGWNEQGFWDTDVSFCKYERDFIKYFDRQGIDLSHALARVIVGTTTGITSIVEGISTTLGVSAKLLPFVLVFLVGIAGWGVYRVVKKRTA